MRIFEDILIMNDYLENVYIIIVVILFRCLIEEGYDELSSISIWRCSHISTLPHAKYRWACVVFRVSRCRNLALWLSSYVSIALDNWLSLIRYRANSRLQHSYPILSKRATVNNTCAIVIASRWLILNPSDAPDQRQRLQMERSAHNLLGAIQDMGVTPVRNLILWSVHGITHSSRHVSNRIEYIPFTTSAATLYSPPR